MCYVYLYGETWLTLKQFFGERLNIQLLFGPSWKIQSKR